LHYFDVCNYISLCIIQSNGVIELHYNVMGGALSPALPAIRYAPVAYLFGLPASVQTNTASSLALFACKYAPVISAPLKP
jgi:hypothetical protein